MAHSHLFAYTPKGLVKWIPRVGLDPTLSESALSVGAMVYAKSLSQGVKEDIAHDKAEQAAYEHTYGATFTHPVGTS